MKTKSILLAAVSFSAACLCLAETSEARRVFPEVGKEYKIEYIADQTVGSAMVQTGVSVYSSSTVKVLARGEHQWCLVERVLYFGMDKTTHQRVMHKERLWLNFAQLIDAKEVNEGHAAVGLPAQSSPSHGKARG